MITGICFTLSTAATAYPASIDRKAALEEEDDLEVFLDDAEGGEADVSKHKKVSKRMWMLAYALNIVFQAFGFVNSVASVTFGPVSLYTPVCSSAQIISGMIMFGYVLKTEDKPSKETRVGNYVIMIATILLIFNGAKVKQETQDLDQLLLKTESLILGGILLAMLLISCPYQFLLGCTDSPWLTYKLNFTFLQMSEISNTVIGVTANKLISVLTGVPFWVNGGVVVLTNFNLLYSGILRSMVIESQNTYLPINFSLIIITNAVVGIVIWEDEVQSMGGYVCVFCLLLLGVYLVSDYNLLVGQEQVDWLVESAGGRSMRGTLAKSALIGRKSQALSVLIKARASVLRDGTIPKIEQKSTPFNEDAGGEVNKKTVHFQSSSLPSRVTDDDAASC